MNTLKLIRDARQIARDDGLKALFDQFVSRYRRKFRYRRAEFRYMTLGDGQIPFRSPQGPINLHINPDWSAAGRYASGEQYEPLLMDELSKRLGKDDVFYNVGARWGVFSVLAERSGVPPEQIHSFEADAETYCLLAQNLDNLETYLYHGYVDNKEGAGTTTIDKYTEYHAAPTVMKIDVEGAEGRALRGAENVLEERPTLFVEIHPQKLHAQDDDQMAVIELLESYNYEIRLCLDNRANIATWEPLRKSMLPTGDVDYLIKAL